MELGSYENSVVVSVSDVWVRIWDVKIVLFLFAIFSWKGISDWRAISATVSSFWCGLLPSIFCSGKKGPSIDTEGRSFLDRSEALPSGSPRLVAFYNDDAFFVIFCLFLFYILGRDAWWFGLQNARQWSKHDEYFDIDFRPSTVLSIDNLVPVGPLALTTQASRALCPRSFQTHSMKPGLVRDAL